jgi:hypothetical protein
MSVSLVMVCVLGLHGYALAAAAVDLGAWSQQGNYGAGNWNVSSDGQTVLQTINGAPTMFVSRGAVLDTTVIGRFKVETTSDDDFIGFVFGYNAPLPGDHPNYMDLILFDWKQGSQLGAPAGFGLHKVLGAHNGASNNANELWLHVDSDNLDATQLGTPLINAGWADRTEYTLELIYQQTRIEIYIESQTAPGPFATKQKVYDVSIGDLPADTFPGNVFPAGRFGFYNYSQPSVRYTGFIRTDDPVLQTVPDDGAMLDLGSVRVGTTSPPGDLTITNGAEIGSLLTGTVASATGEFAGPTPDHDFSVYSADFVDGGEVVVVDKQFTYTPTARGSDTQNIAITTDGGNNTVTLAGKGVGPVFDDNAPVSGLDLGGVYPNDPPALSTLRIFNESTDTEIGDLTDLSIVSAVISGTDAGFFSAPGFLPGTTVERADATDLQVEFDPQGADPGVRNALLTLVTDQNAAFGGSGDIFVYDLAGEIVPEPATLGMLALLALSLPKRGGFPRQNLPMRTRVITPYPPL